jgi:CelD/BcsL family acetyltransferase involved in cellulose biosynthesis
VGDQQLPADAEPLGVIQPREVAMGLVPLPLLRRERALDGSHQLAPLGRQRRLAFPVRVDRSDGGGHRSGRGLPGGQGLDAGEGPAVDGAIRRVNPDLGREGAFPHRLQQPDDGRPDRRRGSAPRARQDFRCGEGAEPIQLAREPRGDQRFVRRQLDERLRGEVVRVAARGRRRFVGMTRQDLPRAAPGGGDDLQGAADHARRIQQDEVAVAAHYLVDQAAPLVTAVEVEAGDAVETGLINGEKPGAAELLPQQHAERGRRPRRLGLLGQQLAARTLGVDGEQQKPARPAAAERQYHPVRQRLVDLIDEGAGAGPTAVRQHRRQHETIERHSAPLSPRPDRPDVPQSITVQGLVRRDPRPGRAAVHCKPPCAQPARSTPRLLPAMQLSVQHSPAGDAHRPDSPLRIETITTTAGFAALRSEWDNLLTRSGGSVFQSWEWLHTWWQHLGRGRLWILALRRGPELRGLAPLFVARYPGTLLRRVGFLGTGAADYLQFLVDADIQEYGHAQLLAGIAAARHAWDFCDFQQIPEASQLAAMVAPAGLHSERFVQETCPYLALPTTWEEFAAGLGKKLRSNLGYCRRRLERDFQVEWATAGAGDLTRCMERFFALHQRRWNRRWLPGAFAGQRARGFHLSAAALLLDRGWLRLHVLRLNGREEAALYCFGQGGRGYYYLGGFEPELARYSLGTLLTGRAIELAIGEGAVEFDFLRGDEPYKYIWGAANRENRRWLWWKPGALDAIVPRLNRLERSVEARIKAFARGRR